MPRSWPGVDERTIHLVGDIHWGHIVRSRLDRTLADLQSGYEDMPPAARVQVGDLTHFSDAAQYVGGMAWMNSLPASRLTLPGGRQWVGISGNHDTVRIAYSRVDESNSYGYTGVLGDWNTVTGWPDAYSVDLGFVRLLMVGWNKTNNNNRLSASQMAFLNSEASAAGSQECWIVTHAPIYNSVTGPLAGKHSVYDSTIAGFYILGVSDTQSADMLALIAGHSNIRAFFSGHTHSPIGSPGFMQSRTLGGKTVAIANASSLIWSYDDDKDQFVDLRSPYVTRDDNGIAMRFRDHGLATWVGPYAGARELRVNL